MYLYLKPIKVAISVHWISAKPNVNCYIDMPNEMDGGVTILIF